MSHKETEEAIISFLNERNDNLYEKENKEVLKRLLTDLPDVGYELVFQWLKTTLPVTEDALILMLKLMLDNQKIPERVEEIFSILLLQDQFMEKDRYLDLIALVNSGNHGKTVCAFLEANATTLPVYTYKSAVEILLKEQYSCEQSFPEEILRTDPYKRLITLEYIARLSLERFAPAMTILLNQDATIEECEIILFKLTDWDYKAAADAVRQFKEQELALYDLDSEERERISLLIARYEDLI